MAYNFATVKEPDKLPLTFEIDIESIPPGYRRSVEEFKKLCEQELFNWDSFSIQLPPTLLNECANETLQLQDLFKAPDFDESELLARDPEGNLKRLNGDQLDQVREMGEFEVDSLHFPGEKHRWRLNRLIQKGTQVNKKVFWKDLSRALLFIAVYARGRIVGKRFSFRSALRGGIKGVRLLFDLFIGLPYTNPGDVERKLLEERLLFHVCELGVKASQKKYLEEFWDYFEQLIYLPPEARRLHTENPDQQGARLPPYLFVTPSRLPIDMRLHNDPLLQRCLDIVKATKVRAKAGWFQEFKERMVVQLKQEGKTYEQIKEMVQKASLKEHANRLFDAMRESDDLASIDPTIVEPLIRQARFYLILCEAQENLASLWTARHEEACKQLEADHAVLYLTKQWRSKKLRQVQREFEQSHTLSIHEYSLEKCQEEGLEQHAYFLQRDLTFLDERQPLLSKELLKSSFPDSEFSFGARLVFPTQWQVKRHVYDDVQIVENVILDAKPEEEPPLPPLDQGYQMSPADMRDPSDVGRESETYYTVHKDKVFHSSTKYPFWRWINFFLNTYVWILRCLQLFFIRIPFRSRVSYFALFKSTPIYSRIDFDRTTGYLYRSQHGKRHTLASRLRALWRHIHQSRARFEAAPPSGFLDRNVARHFHRLWTYGIQGCLGTFGLCLVMPPVCLLLSTLAIIMGILVPLWVPVCSLAIHVLANIFFDMYKPVSRRNRVVPLFEAVVWHILIRGLIQGVIVLLVATVFCPLLFAIIAFFAALRYAFRSLWDIFIFHAVVKRHARVPAKEDFVARRIAGPGTAANHFFQARTEQILAVLESQLEILELSLWKQQVQMIAKKPKRAYERFMAICMSPFSLGLVLQGNYNRIVNRERDLLDDLRKKLNDRNQALKIDVSFNQLNKVKLPSEDLNLVLYHGRNLTEKFYTNRIHPRLEQLNLSESDWWEEKEVREGDCAGLCSHLLARVFGEQFFTCIEQADKVFQLEVEHLNLSRYIEMLDTTEFRDDLDTVTMTEGRAVMAPGTTYMRVELPSIPLGAFSPGSVTSLPTKLYSYPGRKRRYHLKFGKMGKRLLPRHHRDEAYQGFYMEDSRKQELCQLYHPAIIALLLHRRDRENHVLDLTQLAVREVVTKVITFPLISTRWESMHTLCRTEDNDTATTATADTDTGSGGAGVGQEPDLLRSVQGQAMGSRGSLDSSSLSSQQAARATPEDSHDSFNGDVMV